MVIEKCRNTVITLNINLLIPPLPPPPPAAKPPAPPPRRRSRRWGSRRWRSWQPKDDGVVQVRGACAVIMLGQEGQKRRVVLE